MPMIERFNFYDNNSNSYNFQVFPTGTSFLPNAGVYMFTKRWTDQQGKIWHTIIYIGETRSFRDRPLNSNHPKWESANQLGFDHICVYPTNNRVWVQNALIDKYNPPLNRT